MSIVYSLSVSKSKSPFTARTPLVGSRAKGTTPSLMITYISLSVGKPDSTSDTLNIRSPIGVRSRIDILNTAPS